MMPENTAVRLLGIESDREKKTGAPSYPPPGLMPALAALVERLTVELAKVQPRTTRTRRAKP